MISDIATKTARVTIKKGKSPVFFEKTWSLSAFSWRSAIQYVRLALLEVSIYGIFSSVMEINFMFFVNSILMGFALAMDAFSVSVANALAEPGMKRRKMFAIAGTFGGFQILMPLVGWCCVFVLSEIFGFFKEAVPWIALVLLAFLGIKMIVEAVRNKNTGETAVVTAAALLLQGIATSIDALSVGFTIAGYTWLWAVIEALIIGAVTFGVCMGGLHIGRAIGSRLKNIAGIIGGIILICIGLEIFLTHIL